jgi:DNA polymerase-3 subunit epsilon
MTVVWCDTETTGLEPINSGAFELAFMVYKESVLLEERLFYLNPLDDEVLFHESAFDVNGIPEETIRSYPPAYTVVPEIIEFLKKYIADGKMYFAGYKCSFDYGHVSALFFRCGFNMGDYFNGEMIDVLELVKKATSMKLLPRTENQKLETMCKALGITIENAHSALADIRGTRRLLIFTKVLAHDIIVL